MSETVFVVGHRNPDNDSISAAVAYANLKNVLAERACAEGEEPALVYKPVRLGPLPAESEWVLETFGFEVPELVEGAEAGQKLVLVDHNEVRQAIPGIEDAEVVEIIDHHRIADVMTANPIMYLNLPWGSTASIVTRLYKDYGVEITPEVARVLLSAILTDTVILKSPTATAVDEGLVAELAEIAGVDAVKYGVELFKKRGGEEAIEIEKFVGADAKEFQVGDKVVLIAQHETVDLEGAMAREAEARAHMNDLLQKNDYDFVLLLVTDIVAEGSQFLVEGNTELVNRVFEIECNAEGGNWMPGVLSRKKQVAAPILAG
ncbi:MAG: manganese-dependent inorganic pyrophosphatase [Coriobacteriia bacterium]|nr:manganese-dependent inorganic pyrophosphatase [Coriobacteriia bacterium]